MPAITLNVSAGVGTRIQAAYSRILAKDATLDDVKAVIVARIKADVKEYEQAVLREALAVPAEIAVT